MRDLDLPRDLQLAVPDLDAHHARQVRLLHAFSAAAGDGSRQEAAERALAELRLHTASHFEAEEALMRQCGYPAEPAHREEHARLLEHLDRMAADFAAAGGHGAAGAPMVAEALRLWLSVHIQTMDLAFARFLGQPAR